MNKHKKCDKHHIVPSSQGGSSVNNNTIIINRHEHRNFHAVFDNLTPHEQIIQLLGFNRKCMTEDAVIEIVNKIEDLLKHDCFYKKGVIKGE